MLHFFFQIETGNIDMLCLDYFFMTYACRSDMFSSMNNKAHLNIPGHFFISFL